MGKITFSSPVISIETNTHECIDADKNFIGIFGLCYRSKNDGYNYEHSETYLDRFRIGTYWIRS